jgi:predicted dehydrogenase
MDRRDFIKSAGLTIGAGLAGTLEARNVAASDRISIAVIGCNGRGSAHIAGLVDLPGAEVTYVCDVDSRAIDKGIALAAKKQAHAPKPQKDFRKVLADPSVDAVTIAAPDHWHSPMGILALAAGKHVYIEKPLSQNPHEGELVMLAEQKYKKVAMMGAQRRSFPNLQQGIKEIHNGAIGKAYFARTWYTNSRASIGTGKPAAVPEWLDYELWQGPAPRKPYQDNLIHYNWHWFWHWGTGEALNNGTHEVDVARWALGVNYPSRVASTGGRYQWQDDWQTADTQIISMDYPEGKTISWEGRSCCGFNSEGLDRGVMIYGTEGAALLDSNSYKIYDKKKKLIKEVLDAKEAAGTNTLSATGQRLDQMHLADFLECIRTGKKPNCPIEEGHKSVVGLHLGNIAWRVGRELHCDAANGHITGDAEAAKLWRREYEPGWEPKV